VGRRVNLGNGWTRETKVIKGVPAFDYGPMMKQAIANVQKASNPFIVLKVSAGTMEKVNEAHAMALRAIMGDLVGKAETNSLLDLLPLRCKVGFYLLRKIRIPFLVYLFDGLWFRHKGHYRKEEIRYARETLVTNAVVSVPQPVDFISVNIKIRDKKQ